MIELIYNTLRAPFIIAASASLNGAGSIFYQTVVVRQQDSNGYTSFWKANETKYQQLLDAIIEAAEAEDTE